MTRSSIFALIKGSKVIEEQFALLQTPTTKQTLEMKTTTGLEFAFAPDSKPEMMAIRITYELEVQGKESAIVATYKSKTLTEFQVLEKIGFEDWYSMPAEAPLPYLAFAHYLSRERASLALRHAGLNNINLPIPDEFLNGDKPLEISAEE